MTGLFGEGIDSWRGRGAAVNPARRFEAGCRRYGLTTAGRDMRVGLLRLPPRAGDQLRFSEI